MKLIIISNRLPVTIVEENNEFKITHSTGGLATGLDSLETSGEKHWVGWPGMYIEDEEDRKEIDQKLEEMNFHPVYLTPEQIENYYEGYSNSVLWPMCHYFNTYVEHENKYWEAYKEVNELFCKVSSQFIEPDDIVWVQDYQLMLLPGLIREQHPEVSLGYFHHIPFPSYELFRTLPERADILKGLLGADLVAFHTYDYMRHFISAVFRVLNLDFNLDEIQIGDRVIDVDAFPMGINYNQFHDAIEQPEIKEKAWKLKEKYGNIKLIVSVDRLDYSKGILTRLKCFDEFLENHEEYKGKVSLFMIVAPSRDNVERYAELKTSIDKMVGNINGKYSTISWAPIYYFYRSFPFEELAALYYISDIALVTPLRDGMNLVAKEYLATKRNKPGVLILSEMAGAAVELSDAIIVNPTDCKEIQNGILHALEMPLEEKNENLQKMQDIISTQTVQQWAKDFIDELKSIKAKNERLRSKIINEPIIEKIKDRYDSSSERLIILDYDGTLAPFVANPQRAIPSTQLMETLETLSNHPKNHIVISSGRDRKTLDQWFGKLPIGLAAEHGAAYKEDGEWHQNLGEIQWDEEIIHILEHTVKKTPHSKIEIKNTAIVWHYRNVDPWLADLRITQLINTLINPCSRQNLQIMKGNKILEIKSPEFNKGKEVKRLLEQAKYDFVMAIGDDTTDEDMFAVLPEGSISIKVGNISDVATYNLPRQSQVLPFLKHFTL